MNNYCNEIDLNDIFHIKENVADNNEVFGADVSIDKLTNGLNIKVRFNDSKNESVEEVARRYVTKYENNELTFEDVKELCFKIVKDKSDYAVKNAINNIDGKLFFKIISDTFPKYQRQIKEYILQNFPISKYPIYLNTVYWKTISHLKRFFYSQCYNCDDKCVRLEVHHKTYDILGEEYQDRVFNNGLYVVCKDCHTDIHSDKVNINSNNIFRHC